MKKFIALLFVSVLSILLVSCGNQYSEEEAITEATTEATEEAIIEEEATEEEATEEEATEEEATR